MNERWFVVDAPWGNATWINSGSEDPHGGRFVCDCLDAESMDNERAQDTAAKIVAMERLVHNLLDPEMYGYAVTAEVRDAARVALGMTPVETKKPSNGEGVRPERR